MRSYPLIHSCRLCKRPCHEQVLDFGMQPICNRFLQQRDEPQELFPLSLCYCPACGVPQVAAPVPASMVKPRYDWITYREAEPHLDELVDQALARSSAGSKLVVGGLSYKDATTLDRFRRRGAGSVWQLSPREDLLLENDHAEMEMIQDRLTPSQALSIADRKGRCDILVARHLLEHSHDPVMTLQAVMLLLKENGLILFEVPDFARCMDLLDYAPVWEEHILYFNARTLPHAISAAGFSVIHTYEHLYSLENAVICMGRPQNTGDREPEFNTATEADEDRWVRYAASFESTRDRVQTRLQALSSQYGPVAIFGAGHLSCKFINFYNADKYVTFVADNDHNKTGLYMAGSGLPIQSSEELLKQGVKVCLLGLSPDSERKVRDSHRSFVEAGGIFMSIFPSNPTCFLNNHSA